MPLSNRKGKVTFTVLVAGILFIVGVATLKPKPERAKREPPPLLMVEVIDAAPKALSPTIVSQGTVAPKREIDLVSQVSGKVIGVAESYASGSFFRASDKLNPARTRRLSVFGCPRQSSGCQSRRASSHRKRPLTSSQARVARSRRQHRQCAVFTSTATGGSRSRP